MAQRKTEYQKQKEIWYKKLKNTKSEEYPNGFEDIESDENNLKEWSSKFARKKSMDSMEAKQMYYSLATQFLNIYHFENELERVIWTYHTEGISVRNIAKTLKKVKLKKTNRQTVWLVVKKLRTAMKKMYVNE